MPTSISNFFFLVFLLMRGSFIGIRLSSARCRPDILKVLLPLIIHYYLYCNIFSHACHLLFGIFSERIRDTFPLSHECVPSTQIGAARQDSPLSAIVSSGTKVAHR